MIVHDSVPADCIEKVVRQKGDRTLHARLSTPRPALERVLKSAWKLQQEQQQEQQPQQDTLKGCGKPLAEQIQGTPTDNPNPRSFEKPLPAIDLLVEEEDHEF